MGLFDRNTDLWGISNSGGVVREIKIPKTKDELIDIIREEMKNTNSNDIDLNFIEVDSITDFSMLFSARSEYGFGELNPNIKCWKFWKPNKLDKVDDVATTVKLSNMFSWNTNLDHYPFGEYSLNQYTETSNCFLGCTGLKEVNMPKLVKWSNGNTIDTGSSSVNIDKGMFSGCINLESVHIPDGVCSISEDAFKECPIKELHLDEWMQYIDENAFSNVIENIFYNGSESDWNIKTGKEDIYNIKICNYHLSYNNISFRCQKNEL